MADSRVNIILGARDEASKVVNGVRGSFERFKKDAIAGFGLGAGIGVFNLATRALGGVVDVMGDAIRAAAEEQASIARLTTSIEANVEAWDGNLAAVEEVINAREELAFGDQQQRDSLALLVAATNDVTKALELQRIAMDLSRLRGTELIETTTLISKVYQGNLTSLKRFGINLKGVSTATEALAKIQELSAGQAEAYADTAIGAADRMQIEYENAMEEIGAAVLPVATMLMNMAADAAQSATDILSGRPGQDSAVDLVWDEQEAMQAYQRLADKLGITQDELAYRINATGTITRSYGQAMAVVADVGEEILRLTDEQIEENTQLANAYALVQQALLDRDIAREKEETKEAAQAAYLLMRRQQQLSSEYRETATATDSWAAALDNANESIDEMADLRPINKLNAAIKNQRHLMLQAARDNKVVAFWRHKSNLTALRGERDLFIEGRRGLRGWKQNQREQRREQKETTTTVEETTAAVVRLDQTDPVITPRIVDWQTIQARLEAFRQQITEINRLSGSYDTYDPTGGGAVIWGGPYPPGKDNNTYTKRASGGPVRRGETYVVGERGPELLHMGSQSGRITPNGGGHSHVIVMDGRVVGQLIDERLGRRATVSARSGAYRS